VRDFTFRHFETVPACDGLTDGQTGTHDDSIASRGKNCGKDAGASALHVDVRISRRPLLRSKQPSRVLH